MQYRFAVAHLILVRPMRGSLAILLALALFTGCTKETWSRSRAELVDWYQRFGTKKPKVGYAGSGAQYPTRPRVSVADLILV